MHTACVFEKLTVLSCAKQEMCNGMNPGGADPGQTLLTSWKTHPSEPHSETQTYKLTTEVKKYLCLHCIALMWKVLTQDAEQQIMCPSCQCHHGTVLVVVLFLEEILCPRLFSFCKPSNILQ